MHLTWHWGRAAGNVKECSSNGVVKIESVLQDVTKSVGSKEMEVGV